MDNNCSLSPFVGRSLLPPATASCYLLDMLPPATASHYLLDMVLIHVVFVQSRQERPMGINVHSISMPLPCIQHNMNIIYPSIRSLPTPYGLPPNTFSYGQAQVLAICLWLPSLLLECNAILPSPSQHLVRSCMPPSALQCLIQFFQCLSFECNTMLPSSL